MFTKRILANCDITRFEPYPGVAEKGSVVDKGNGIDQDDLFREEPEVDPSWSLLPGNVWNSDDD